MVSTYIANYVGESSNPNKYCFGELWVWLVIYFIIV